ncbi:MAG: hypothetical protein LBB57_01665 [Clostridiales Family XIII bacterium]|jgi:Mn-dependent DtxR family transcriptional regulator|nr:hypothetical protein [Clostridiales Family XIII bacterium]
MSELKSIQKRYLYFVYRCEKEHRSPILSEIATEFGADKSNVNKMLAFLETQGYLSKKSRFYSLREKGRAALSPQAEQAEIACLWLRGSGFDEQTVRLEAFNMILALSPKTAAWAAAEGLFLFAAFRAGARARRELSAFAGAAWRASVLFLKPDGGSADGGGPRDCTAVLKSGRLYLELPSKALRPLLSEFGAGSARGGPARFCYRPRGADGWREAAFVRNRRRIPLDETDISFAGGMLRAQVRVGLPDDVRREGAESAEADLLCTVWFDAVFLRDS